MPSMAPSRQSYQRPSEQPDMRFVTTASLSLVGFCFSTEWVNPLVGLVSMILICRRG